MVEKAESPLEHLKRFKQQKKRGQFEKSHGSTTDCNVTMTKSDPSATIGGDQNNASRMTNESGAQDFNSNDVDTTIRHLEAELGENSFR